MVWEMSEADALARANEEDCQRIPELGTRVALGATPSEVRGLVLCESVKLVAAGVSRATTGPLVARSHTRSTPKPARDDPRTPPTALVS